MRWKPTCAKSSCVLHCRMKTSRASPTDWFLLAWACQGRAGGGKWQCSTEQELKKWSYIVASWPFDSADHHLLKLAELIRCVPTHPCHLGFLSEYAFFHHRISSKNCQCQVTQCQILPGKTQSIDVLSSHSLINFFIWCLVCFLLIFLLQMHFNLIYFNKQQLDGLYQNQ